MPPRKYGITIEETTCQGGKKHGDQESSHGWHSGIQRLHGDRKIDFSLESSVIHQYGNQLRKVALETLKDLDIDNVRITIVDKGALDCTLKARIEGAVFRSVDQYENLPWGGAIR